MSYLEYFESFDKDVSQNLDGVNAIVAELDYPHLKFKSVHVAGTNGKTSVIDSLASIIKEAGYKVGKFSSPYLINFCNQIQVSGEDISEGDVESYLDILKPIIENIGKDSVKHRDVLTAMAFMHFAKQKVDIAVIECEIGGTCDSTNIIKPLVTVITKIDYDHVNILGTTLPEISENICGIIKQDTPLVTSNFSTALTTITSRAESLNADIIRVATKDVSTTHYNIMKPMRLTYGGNHYFTTLKGRHQGINTAVVLEVLKLLNTMGFDIEIAHIGSGLENLDPLARFEALCKKPLVIFDSAHNSNSFKAFMQNVEDYFWGNVKKTVFVVSMHRSENMKESLVTMAKYMPRGGHIIFTNGIDGDFYSANELFNAYAESDKRYQIIDDVAKRRTHSTALCITDFTDAIINATTKHAHDSAIFIIGSYKTYVNAKEIVSNERV